MLTIILISSLLTAGYTLLMMVYKAGWARQAAYLIPPAYEPITFISVIIPARNEAANIGACIASVLAQKYPAELFEIIVVDDHSNDGTADVVKSFKAANVHCIALADHMPTGEKVTAFKKAAITAGISQSKGGLIVTTDADCIAPHTWLINLAAIYEQQQPEMIVAPVIYAADSSIVQVFQLIDFMSMQGITGAAHKLHLGNMCNGANLAFRKIAFYDVGGYEGISHLASGDDYLLMMKINKKFPGGISYLKSADAIISTSPQPGWGSFLQQRIRWASKSGKYNDSRLTGILVLVYLYNVSLAVIAIACIFQPVLLWPLLLSLAVKIIVEYIFLRPVAKFFKKEWVLLYFPFLQPLHVLYIVLAGFMGFIGSYKWKGREVK